MAQQQIGTLWDRVARNGINSNFSELYNKYNDFVGEVTEDIRKELLKGAEINFIDPVETVEELPEEASNGDTAFVTSKGEWHRWDGEAWAVVARTDPTEFISLQSAFAELEQGVDEFKASLNNSFDDFKADVSNTIDDRLGDLQGLLQSFIDSLEGQVVYVEEEGENENGQYIRYSDGAQFCWARPFSQTANISAGSIWRSDLRSWTYPAPFIDTPIVNASVSSYARWADIGGLPSSEEVSLVQYGYSEGTSAYATSVVAFGRWKT